MSSATRQQLQETIYLPSLLGSIAAGFPLEAIEDRQRHELLNLLAEPGRYALRVGDDSMLAAGIYAGDIVIIQSLQRARNGDIVAALIDDEPLALWRIRHLDAGRIRLYGDHSAHGDRELAVERVSIQGKLVGQLRRYP
jgi:repressor LexA